MKNGKMHSTDSRSSGHSDTNLEVLPVKSVLLSAAKRHLTRTYDEDSDEMFAQSDYEEGVFHSQSVGPNESLTATLFDKYKKKKQIAFLRQPKQVARLAGA